MAFQLRLLLGMIWESQISYITHSPLVTLITCDTYKQSAFYNNIIILHYNDDTGIVLVFALLLQCHGNVIIAIVRILDAHPTPTHMTRKTAAVLCMPSHSAAGLIHCSLPQPQNACSGCIRCHTMSYSQQKSKLSLLNKRRSVLIQGIQTRVWRLE